MNLFIRKNIVLHSGDESDFKIECDALGDGDWECLAYLISKRVEFSDVYGVPTGGERLARALKKYRLQNEKLPVLVVDDVLTTGASIIRFADQIPVTKVVGVVVFARGKCPDWITPVFQMM